MVNELIVALLWSWVASRRVPIYKHFIPTGCLFGTLTLSFVVGF
jgi:hypothetical protein